MMLDEDDGAPKPTDALSSPPAKRKAGAGDDRQSDAKLATVMSKTEIMVLNFIKAAVFHNGGVRRSWTF